MPCIEYDPQIYIDQINLSIHRLKALKKNTNAKIEVRVTDLSPTQSISILNGHERGTEMCMLMHLPDGDGQTAPFIRLFRNEDPEWFELFYSRYYKLMWNNSTKII